MKKIIKIGNKLIGQGQPVFVIAEVGVNHNQSLDFAFKLIDVAKNAGADAVKFETFKAEQVTLSDTPMAKYQKKNIGKSESQLSMLKKLELDESFYPKLISYCKKKNIIFLSTPHGGFESVDFLQRLRVPAFKFGSGDLNNLPVLEYAAKFGKPMLISTGMADITEVGRAVDCIRKSGNNKIVLFHCTTNYPCPPQEVNLKAMLTIKDKFETLVGYSDHTLGIQTPIMAVTAGASVVEKHITLDRNMPGPDHKASLEPMELRQMVDGIKLVKTILGSAVKKPNPEEIKLRNIARKSLVTTQYIRKGEVITSDHINIKRPGNGLEPKYYFQVIGARATKNIDADTLIRKDHYEKA